MKLRQFEALRAIVRTGTTSEAAEYLSLTQSAVSKLLGQLEDELNIKIFDRRHGRLIMTPEGKMMYTDIELVLNTVDAIKNKSKDTGALKAGALKIGAMPALGHGLIPSVLRRFTEMYPGVQCSVDIKPREQIEELVTIGHYDIGLITMPVETQRLKVEHLANAEAVCILPVDHELVRLKEISALDLEGKSYISVDTETLLRHRVDLLFSEMGVKRNLKIHSQTSLLVCQLVAAGAGISIVHPLIASAFESRLAIRPFNPAINLEYSMLLPHGEQSRLTQTFMSFLVKGMKELQDRLNP